MQIKMKNTPTEKISRRILYVLSGFVVLAFVGFYLVGFDHPFYENPAFNSPLLTDVVLGTMYLLLLSGIGVAVWAVVREARLRAHEEKVVNNIRAALLSRSIVGGTVLLLVLTALLGSATPIMVNGKEYADALWLKVADVFIFSSLILLVVAIGVVLFGATRYIRKENKRQ